MIPNTAGGGERYPENLVAPRKRRAGVKAAQALHCECWNTLQRNIPVLLRRVLIPLIFEHRQRLDQFLARLVGLNDGVDKTAQQQRFCLNCVRSSFGRAAFRTS